MTPRRAYHRKTVEELAALRAAYQVNPIPNKKQRERMKQRYPALQKLAEQQIYSWFKEEDARIQTAAGEARAEAAAREARQAREAQNGHFIVRIAQPINFGEFFQHEDAAERESTGSCNEIQVRMCIRKKCKPLSDTQYKPVLMDN